MYPSDDDLMNSIFSGKDELREDVLAEAEQPQSEFLHPDTNPYLAPLLTNSKERWSRIRPSILSALTNISHTVCADEASSVLTKFNFRCMEGLENPKACPKCGNTNTKAQGSSIKVRECQSCGTVFDAAPNWTSSRFEPRSEARTPGSQRQFHAECTDVQPMQKRVRRSRTRGEQSTLMNSLSSGDRSRSGLAGSNLLDRSNRSSVQDLIHEADLHLEEGVQDEARRVPSCWGCGDDWKSRWSSNDLATTKKSSKFGGSRICPDCVEEAGVKETDFAPTPNRRPSIGPKGGDHQVNIYDLVGTHHACGNCGWSGQKSDATHCPNCRFGKLRTVDHTGKEVTEGRGSDHDEKPGDEKPGTVCSDCGRTATHAEYSSGQTTCCKADVVPEEEYGQPRTESRHDSKSLAPGGTRVLYANRVHLYAGPKENAPGYHRLYTTDGYTVEAHEDDIQPYVGYKDGSDAKHLNNPDFVQTEARKRSLVPYSPARRGPGDCQGCGADKRSTYIDGETGFCQDCLEGILVDQHANGHEPGQDDRCPECRKHLAKGTSSIFGRSGPESGFSTFPEDCGKTKRHKDGRKYDNKDMAEELIDQFQSTGHVIVQEDAGDPINSTYSVHMDRSVLAPGSNYHDWSSHGHLHKIQNWLNQAGLGHDSDRLTSYGYEDVSLDYPSKEVAHQAARKLDAVLPRASDAYHKNWLGGKGHHTMVGHCSGTDDEVPMFHGYTYPSHMEEATRGMEPRQVSEDHDDERGDKDDARRDEYEQRKKLRRHGEDLPREPVKEAVSPRSEWAPDQVAQARATLTNAEQSLGTLSHGQRADLLMDHHPWLRHSGEARRLVNFLTGASSPHKGNYKVESVAPGYLISTGGNNAERPDAHHHEDGHEVPHASLALQDLHRRLGSALPELHALVISTITDERTALSMLFNELHTAHCDMGNALSCSNQVPDVQMQEIVEHYSRVVSQMLGALNPYLAKNPAVSTGPYHMGGILHDNVQEADDNALRPDEVLTHHRWLYDHGDQHSDYYVHPNHPDDTIKVHRSMNFSARTMPGRWTHHDLAGKVLGQGNGGDSLHAHLRNKYQDESRKIRNKVAEDAMWYSPQRSHPLDTDWSYGKGAPLASGQRVKVNIPGHVNHGQSGRIVRQQSTSFAVEFPHRPGKVEFFGAHQLDKD